MHERRVRNLRVLPRSLVFKAVVGIGFDDRVANAGALDRDHVLQIGLHAGVGVERIVLGADHDEMLSIHVAAKEFDAVIRAVVAHDIVELGARTGSARRQGLQFAVAGQDEAGIADLDVFHGAGAAGGGGTAEEGWIGLAFNLAIAAGRARGRARQAAVGDGGTPGKDDTAPLAGRRIRIQAEHIVAAREDDRALHRALGIDLVAAIDHKECASAGIQDRTRLNAEGNVAVRSQGAATGRTRRIGRTSGRGGWATVAADIGAALQAIKNALIVRQRGAGLDRGGEGADAIFARRTGNRSLIGQTLRVGDCRAAGRCGYRRRRSGRWCRSGCRSRRIVDRDVAARSGRGNLIGAACSQCENGATDGERASKIGHGIYPPRALIRHEAK